MRAALSFTACMFGLVVRLDAAAQVDHATLPRLLAERGFVPPEAFKALVVKVTRTEQGGLSRSYFDFHGSSTQADFWPASTIKLYAAVAALERTRALGFPPAARVTFQYPEGPFVTRVREVVRHALVPSDNRAYDQLVELAGFDHLHGEFLTEARGFPQSALLRSYYGRVRDPVTGNGLAGESPAIELEHGKKQRSLPPRTATCKPECPEQGNCTTLRELADALLRVVLHDELPEAERFALGAQEIKLLRQFLATERARGMNVVTGLREAFGAEVAIRTWHKPGYALQWFSDVVLVEIPERSDRYIVAMAGYPGREALDSASRHVGALLAAGSL